MSGVQASECSLGQCSDSDFLTNHPGQDSPQEPSRRDSLQALLAFSALYDKVRRRKARAFRPAEDDARASDAEVEDQEDFDLDEVLQLVADRALALTGADGLAIALAENNELVLRVAVGSIRPDVGARIDRDSAFSGTCFRTLQIVRCDDTEKDVRVNLQVCRRLGARSMVAVPLCGRRGGMGLLEAFSAEPFGFDDSDVRALSLLSDLVVAALKPEDEDRFAESGQVAATKLEGASRAPEAAPNAFMPAPVARLEPALVVIGKPLEATASPAGTTNLHELALAPEQVPLESEPAIAIKDTVKEASAQEPNRPTYRPGKLFLLVCVVIAAAFAGGVWWDLHTPRLRGAMVRPTEIAPKPVGTAAKQATAVPSALPDAKANTAIIQPGVITARGQASSSDPTLQGSSQFPRVTGIQYQSSTDSSTVVVSLEDQVQYEAHRLIEPDRVYFDLHDTRLAAELAGKSIEVGDGQLSRIRMAQPVDGITRVVLETQGKKDFSVRLEPNPYRLVVEVGKIKTKPAREMNLFPGATGRETSDLATVTREDSQLRGLVPRMRIVIDAGHGGRDQGTVGRDGLLEKDLVLEIARRLGKLLEGRLGMSVVYTRQNDSYLPLEERADIANQAQADLFVSVHANYSDLPSARGVETYYTNFVTARGAKDASLSHADLQERTEQSRRLAFSVQHALCETLSAQNPGVRDRGTKEAGFVVLTESAMPGILAEVSFVSSPADEQRLLSDGYREQVAEGLYKGIVRYAAGSEGLKVAIERR